MKRPATKKRQRSSGSAAWGPVLFLLVLFALGKAFLLPIRMEDWRLAAYADTDALTIFNSFVRMLSTHNFIYVPGRYANTYGYFSFYLGYLVVVLRGLLGAGREMGDLYLALRWVSFLSGIGCCALYFAMQRTYRLPAWFGYAATLFTVSVWQFVHWSYEPKPDVPQYFLILASLTFLPAVFNSGTWRSLLFCTVFIALAASTKMVGIFLLPVMLTADAAGAIQRRELTWKRCILHTGVCSVLIAGVYLLCNLRWLTVPKEALTYYTATLGAAPQSWTIPSYMQWGRWEWGWWVRLWDFGWPLVTGFFFYIALRLRRRNLQADDFLLIFTLVFIALLGFATRYQSQETHLIYYLLPCLPGILMANARLIDEIATLAGRRKSWVIAALLIAILVLYAPRLRTTAQLVRSEVNYWKTSPIVQAGLFVKKRYTPQTHFLRNYCFWLPEQFPYDVPFVPYAPTPKEFADINPDVVLLCNAATTATYVPNLGGLHDALATRKLPYVKITSFNNGPGNELEVFEHENLRERLTSRKP